MKDDQLKYHKRGFSGRKDRVNYSRRRYERNIALIVQDKRADRVVVDTSRS